MKKLIIIQLIFFLFFFSGCNKLNNDSDYEAIIQNYCSKYNSLSDKNKSDGLSAQAQNINLIKELGVCIEDTKYPNSWLTPDKNIMPLVERVTEEKLYESGAIMFTIEPKGWIGITKAINIDFSDVDMIAIALYIEDQYAFDSCTVYLASTESYGKYNYNNWEKYYSASCGNVATRLHRGCNFIKLHRDDFICHNNETWGIFKSIRFVVQIPSHKWNLSFSENIDELIDTTKFGIGGIYLNPVSEKPKLMFSFDDSSRYMFENAFPYMEQYGIKGTLFVCHNHIVENGGSERTMTEAQHDILYSTGWNIGNHSTTHGDIYSMTEEEIYWEYKTTRDYLLSKGWTTGGILSAPPNGRNNYISNKVLYELGYKIVRGNKACLIDGITPDNILLYPTYEIRSDTPLETTLARIDEAIKKGSSISIFTHHVVESDPDTFSTTIDYFKAVVDYAVKMKEAGLLDIVTVSEFYNSLKDKSIAQRGIN